IILVSSLFYKILINIYISNLPYPNNAQRIWLGSPCGFFSLVTTWNNYIKKYKFLSLGRATAASIMFFFFLGVDQIPIRYIIFQPDGYKIPGQENKACKLIKTCMDGITLNQNHDPRVAIAIDGLLRAIPFHKGIIMECDFCDV
ncbi:hypothetical protein ACJX0J_028757, partial [Zea mays]